MTLGQKLKKLRSEKGLTQKDLADQLHVTFQTVSKWENDENEPDIATLKELSKIFGYSVDELLSEDDLDHKEEEKEEEKPAPAPTTIVIHQKELHVCEKCKKDIPEGELEMEQVCVRPAGRGHAATYRQAYYHRDCLKKVRQERAYIAAQANKAKASRAKKLSFGWGIAGGVVALAISLLIFLLVPYFKQHLHPGLAVLFSFLISYAIFSDIYCIITGSYIGDIFVHVAGWSIRFPGLIFTWDLGGFIWLIGMKILFGVLGFLFGVFVIFAAVSISALFSMVSFPFILGHNIATDYADAL